MRNRLQRPFCRAAAAAAALALLLLAAPPALAQLPVARLTAVFPPGGRIGSTFDVAATGQDLEGARELHFSHPGITAKRTGDGDSPAEATFTVTVAPDVPVGTYEARVVGRLGVTNPRAFAVGDRPIEEPPKSNHSPGSAARLSLGPVVYARCTANAVDYYSLELKQGKRVLIECESREIDSKMIPVLILADADGREVDRSRRGGLLDFTAPHEGVYTLQVHDQLYRGGAEYGYQLSAGTGPHLDAIFPPAGLPGTKSKYTLYGRGLPGGTPCDLRAADGKPLEQLEVEIELPSDPAARQRLDADPLVGTVGASLDGVEYRFHGDSHGDGEDRGTSGTSGTSNPVLLTFARAPIVVEHEPNDKPAEAMKITPPCEVVGRFYPHGDSDWFTFEAGKGDAFWIEVTAERLGEPAAPFVLVQRVKKDDKGKEQTSDVLELSAFDGPGGAAANPGGPSLRTATRDPGAKFEAKEAGTYRLLVRDLFNTGEDNAALVYRLSIRPARPDFRLVAVPTTDPTGKGMNGGNPKPDADVLSPFLRRGGTAVLKVIVLRQEGFNGEVHLEAEGLPPGVTCAGATVSGNDSLGILVFTADEDAAAWAGAVRVVGKAKLGDEQVTRDARPGTVVWGATPANGTNAAEPGQARLASDLEMAVSGDEVEPLTLAPEGDTFEAVAGATVKIPVKVTRRAEFKQPLKIKVIGPSALANAKDLTLDAKADSGVVEVELSKQKFPPGTYTLYLQAQTTLKYEAPPAPTGSEKDKTGDKPKDKSKNDANKAKKANAKDVAALFVSRPITLKVTEEKGQKK